jgi:hypothetical protein
VQIVIIFLWLILSVEHVKANEKLCIVSYLLVPPSGMPFALIYRTVELAGNLGAPIMMS